MLGVPRRAMWIKVVCIIVLKSTLCSKWKEYILLFKIRHWYSYPLCFRKCEVMKEKYPLKKNYYFILMLEKSILYIYFFLHLVVDNTWKISILFHTHLKKTILLYLYILYLVMKSLQIKKLQLSMQLHKWHTTYKIAE